MIVSVNEYGRLGLTRTQPASGSGINKPTDITGKWHHDLHKTQSPSNRVSKLPSTLARSMQNNRLFAALHSDQVDIRPAPPASAPTGPAAAATKPTNAALNIRGAATADKKAGFQIRGSAGPAVIQACNFAPGTTAEDIRHAMAKVGKVLSCLILTIAPSVIAEIVFEKKEEGDRCIRQYDGQKADGRVLAVFYKDMPSVGAIVDHAPGTRDPFKEREEADRRRQEQNIHFQDGRFGVKPPPMYSDALMQKGRGFTR